MPSSSSARMTRTAISPRLATRTFSNMGAERIGRAPAAPRARLLDEPSLHGPARQLMAVGELELAQDGRDVGLDGLRRDAQPQGDLLVEVAAGEQLQDLALARGERVEVGVGARRRRGAARGPRGAAGRAGEGVEDEPGQARGEDRVALVDAHDRVGELGRGDGLRDVAARARADDGDDVLGRVADAQRQEAGARAGVGGAAQDLDAAAVGHVDVEQDHVGARLGDQGDGLVDRLGLPDDVDELAQLCAHAGAEEAVVVDEDDARGGAGVRGVRGAHAPSLGRTSSTSVPSPGVAWTVARPPWRAMRPTIDSRTPRRSPGTQAGSKPGPRSRTKTWTASGVTSA